MKIIILDDDGSTLFEEDHPGYIHMPLIMDGKDDYSCEDDDCVDPRCIERRDECEKFLAQWQRSGQELSLVYHDSNASSPEDFAEFDRLHLPTFRKPRKVKIHGFTRDEIVFSSGERIKFLLPKMNVYGDDQVMFSPGGKFGASLLPWREEQEKKRAQSAKK